MADRYIVVHQGRVILRRGLKRKDAEREAEMYATRMATRSVDHIEVRPDERFEREDNEIYRRYKNGGS